MEDWSSADALATGGQVFGQSVLTMTARYARLGRSDLHDTVRVHISKPLVPEVRGLYAERDMVIALFDASGTARDGKPY